MTTLLIVTCFFCCGTSLWLTHNHQTHAAGTLKIMASLCFVGLAIDLNLHSTQAWFFIGLLLCLLGDAWLTAKGKGKWFILGLLSFLLAHLCYVLAFIQHGINSSYVIGAATAVLVVLVFLARWLFQDMSTKHQKLVLSYLVVIAVMVITAWAIESQNQSKLLLGLGATIFAISDVFVANHRFKKEAFINRLLGLPLYYLAQVLLILGFDKML